MVKKVKAQSNGRSNTDADETMAELLKVIVHDEQKEAMVQVWHVHDDEVEVQMEELRKIKRSGNEGRKHDGS